MLKNTKNKLVNIKLNYLFRLSTQLLTEKQKENKTEIKPEVVEISS